MAPQDPRRFSSAHSFHTWTNPAFDMDILGTERGGQSFFLNTARINSLDVVVAYRGGSDTNRSFSISLSNALLEESLFAQQDYCLSADAIYQLRLDRGHNPSSRCGDTRNACHVWMNYHGWDVRVAVSRIGLYREPEKVCRILRHTLDTWTLSIDDLRRRPGMKRRG